MSPNNTFLSKLGQIRSMKRLESKYQTYLDKKI